MTRLLAACGAALLSLASERLGGLSVEPRPISGPAFGRLAEDEIAGWTRLVRAAGR